jgi:hypothetical protein
LAKRPAWWNPFWVEEYEVAVGIRPDRCSELLKEALPRWGMLPEVPAFFMGYVDQDEFTLYPAWGPWARQKPMAGGRIAGEPRGSRIELRIANSNWAMYVLVLWTVLFWSISIAILMALAGAATSGRVIPNASMLWIFAFFGIAIPTGFLIVYGRPGPRHGNPLEESDDAKFAVQFLEDVFGARPAIVRGGA